MKGGQQNEKFAFALSHSFTKDIASQRTIDVATIRVVVTAKRTMLYLNGNPHEILVSITNFFLLVTDVLQVIHYVPDQFFFWRRLPGCVFR